MYKPHISKTKILSTLERLSPDELEERTETWETVLQEITLFDSYCIETQQSIVSNLWVCVRMLNMAQPDLVEVRKIVKESVVVMKTLNDEIGNYFRMFVELRIAFDRSSGMDSDFDLEILRNYKFANLDFGPTIHMLSDIYSSISDFKNDSADQLGIHAGYHKKKYFIKPENITRIKLDVCAHIPVYRSGTKQGITRLQSQPGRFGADPIADDADGDSDSAPFTCVYFDINKLDIYHDKITQKEGSAMMKVKWPGHSYNQLCTIERKRTAYVLDEHSVKEKMNLGYAKIGEFIAGNLRLKEIHRNTAFLSNADIIASYNAICKAIDKNRLRPSLQSQFSRVLFHNTSQAGIEIYLDYDIIICKEGGDNFQSKNWCSDIIMNPSMITFPMGVLSVKIPYGMSTPDWLTKLTESEYLIPSQKFSKFLHGTSKLHTQKCNLLPGWFSNSLTHRDGHSLRHWFLTNMVSQRMDNRPDHDRSEATRTEYGGLDNIPSESSEDEDRERTRDRIPPLNLNENNSELEPLRKGEQFVKTRVKPSNPLVRTSTIGRRSVWIPPPVTPHSPIKVKRKGLLNVFRKRKFIPKRSGITPLTVPIRVEPKTHFANERTLMQWINVSIFLSIGSLLMFQFNRAVANSMGLSIQVLAILFILYGLFVFHFRRRAIVSRSVDGHYDDKFGPTILVALLFIFIISLAIFQIMFVVPIPGQRHIGAVRNYKIPLSNQFLTGSNFTTNSLIDLKSAIETRITNFLLKGDFIESQVEDINLFDTRSSCLLFKNGYTLREISAYGGQVIIPYLSYTTDDILYIKNLDQAYPTTTYNAYEIYRPIIGFQYIREIGRSDIAMTSITNINNLANTYNNLFISDWIPDVTWGEALEQVNPQTISRHIYGPVNTNFQDNGVSAKLVSLTVSIWTLPDNTPIWGELSVSFPLTIGQDLTKNEILEANNLYEQLISLSGYLDSESTTDEIQAVYGLQNFCT